MGEGGEEGRQSSSPQVAKVVSQMSGIPGTFNSFAYVRKTT